MQDKFTEQFELFLLQKHSKKAVQDLTKFEKYQITDWFYEEQHEKKEYKTRNEAIEAGIQFLKQIHNS